MPKKKDDANTRTPSEFCSEILIAMDEEFHDAPDRVLAIVGAAYLDALLEQLLRAVFLADKEEANYLLGPDRALGSNGSRYQLAYCLGLIEKQQRDDLKAIAKIRNAFAHKYDVRSFDHDVPRGLLANLHYGKELDAIVTGLIENATTAEQRQRLQEIGASGRRKFQDTVRMLFVSLAQRLEAVIRPNKSTWYRDSPL